MHKPIPSILVQPSDQAEDLYVEYLAQVDAGAMDDFDAYCSEHPKQAADPQQLHMEDLRLMNLAQDLGFASGSLVDASDDTSGTAQPVELASDELTRESSRLMESISGRTSSFGKYHLRRLVGQGSMGEVYKVWDEDLRRHLAMKLLSRSYSTNAPVEDARVRRAQARFVEEAQVTSQLDHPGIVPVHDIGVSPQGHLYFTMKLVKGRELLRIIQMVHQAQSGWSLTRALGLILKVTEAMGYAHSKGVLHRDLKPTNVMIGRYGAVYVMDWGLARVLNPGLESVELADGHSTQLVGSDRRDRSADDPDNPEATRDGDSVGTPAYMAPEQARGENAQVGPWTDIYGVGAMLYHLLTGRAPYTEPGQRIGAQAVLWRVREGSPVPTQELAPLVPRELHAVVAKAMARNPKDRYASMEHLSDDIIAFVEGRLVSAGERRRGAGLLKWVQRNPVGAGAAGLILALGVAWMSSDPRETRAAETLSPSGWTQLEQALIDHSQSDLDAEAAGELVSRLRATLAGR